MSFPSHVLVPALDAQYADLGLEPIHFQVVGQSLTAEGAQFVQVFTGAGYLWVKPGEWAEVPTLCAECAADGQEVRGETTHCHCGLAVYS